MKLTRSPLRLSLLAFVFAGCSSDPSIPRNLPAPEYEAPRAFPSATASAEVEEPDQPEVASADTELEELGNQFLSDMFVHLPVRATEAGEHRFDGKWPDLSVNGESAYRTMLNATASKLRAIDASKLSVENAVDRDILSNHIALALFTLDELKPAETDPMFYTALIGDGLDPLVSREFAPASVRAKSLTLRLEGIPALVAAATARLKVATELHTKTAISQNKGLISLVGTGFKELAAQAGADGQRLPAAAKAAETALQNFQTFLEKDLLKKATADVRLGKEKFKKKLALVLDDETAAEALVPAARAFLEATRAEMVMTSKELWPELFKGKAWKEPKTVEEERKLIRAVLNELAKEKSTNATIVKDAEATLVNATAFVRQHDLVRIPNEPCKVVEMPEYRRGVAVAYCDSSGPLETNPQTFYAIAPAPQDWPKKRVESLYREYNRSMLNDLTVHEAMPGHFLQAMHQNGFSSKVRAVLAHGAFVEGWAVYTEWLMAKYGFGGPRVRMQRLKMALRMAANTILDHGVHAANMSEKEALKLMTEESFQEEGEALGKWKRAQLTSAQLTTYFYGFTEMMRLRGVAEKEAGFKERSYHDELLAHGSPAPRYLRRILGK
jgi:uncharacterized protein (DUF885 family)